MEMPKIQVVNKYKHIPTPYDYYIGRGNRDTLKLGNRWSHLPSGEMGVIRVATREEAVALHKDFMDKAMQDPESHTYHAILRLADFALLNGQLNLVCFCKPKVCHGDTIKYWVEQVIKDNFFPVVG